MDIIDPKAMQQVSDLKSLIDKDRAEREAEVLESVISVLPNDISDDNKKVIAKEIVGQVNEFTDENIKEKYKENLLSFSSLVQEGSRVRILDYLSAVKFITYRNSGLNITESYKLTKHDEVSEALVQGVSEEKIANRAKAYSQNKIVKDLQRNSQMPLHMVYGDYLVDGIERLHKVIMKGSDRDAVNAVKTLGELIMPKDNNDSKQDTSMLEDKVRMLTEMQANIAVTVTHQIASGSLSVRDLLQKKSMSNIIEGEVVKNGLE